MGRNAVAALLLASSALAAEVGGGPAETHDRAFWRGIVQSRYPFLDEKEFAGLVSSTLAYLAAEKDLRAFDVRTGWMHATAHTADLLKFLGRNPRLRPADQRRILEALAARRPPPGPEAARSQVLETLEKLGP